MTAVSSTNAFHLHILNVFLDSWYGRNYLQTIPWARCKINNQLQATDRYMKLYYKLLAVEDFNFSNYINKNSSQLRDFNF